MSPLERRLERLEQAGDPEIGLVDVLEHMEARRRAGLPDDEEGDDEPPSEEEFRRMGAFAQCLCLCRWPHLGAVDE